MIPSFKAKLTKAIIERLMSNLRNFAGTFRHFKVVTSSEMISYACDSSANVIIGSTRIQ